MLPFNISEADLATVNIERKSHICALIRTRFMVLYFTALGLRRGKVAMLVGCHRNSVTNYIRMYNEGGLEEIRHAGFVGSPHPLADKVSEIEQEMLKIQPSTLAEVAQMLKDKFDYDRSLEATRLFLHSIGFKNRKVGTFPGKPKDLLEWLDKQKEFVGLLKELLGRAEKQEIDLVFADASHFVYGKFSGRLWSKEPCYSASGHGRYRVNVYGAYDPVNGHIYSAYNEGYVDALFMEFYLNWLRTDCYKDLSIPLHIVLDNARYQHCKMIKELAHNLNIVLEFLPPYSPNLNLIERLWKYIKAILAKQTHSSKITFMDAIIELLNSLGSDKHQQKIKKLLAFKFQTFENAQILT